MCFENDLCLVTDPTHAAPLYLRVMYVNLYEANMNSKQITSPRILDFKICHPIGALLFHIFTYMLIV